MKLSVVGTYALGLAFIGCTDSAPDQEITEGSPIGPPATDPVEVKPEIDAPTCTNGFKRVDLSVDAALASARALVEIGGALRVVATSGVTTAYDGTGTAIVDSSYQLGTGLTSVVSVEGGAFHMPIGCGCGVASLIFSTEGGRLIAVNPALGSSDGVVVVDRSDVGADYKGVAVLETPTGPLLLAADFYNGRLDVFDSHYALVDLGPTAFAGTNLPDRTLGLTNVAVLDGSVYITYATKDDSGHQPAAMLGGGLIAKFAPTGEVLGQMGCSCLSRPFGLALAPAGYVATDKRLLVANKVDGIVGLDPELLDGTVLDFVTRPDGSLLAIDGLSGLTFGAGADAGTLYFTASPDSGGAASLGKIEATCE